MLLLTLICSAILYPAVSAEEVAALESPPESESTPDPPVTESTASVQKEDEKLKKEEDAEPVTEESKVESNKKVEKEEAKPVQSGPFIDLLGETLISLKMVDETHATLEPHYTNEALKGKKVVGLYFSADW